MSIELKPFVHEAEVPLEGGVLRLVVNFRVIDRLEALLGQGMDDLLSHLATSTSMMVKFLWGMTREHHDDLTMDQLAGLLLSPEQGPAVASIIGDLVRRAFHIAEPVGEGEQSRPPPKAKKSSGASRASSRSGAAPA